jgi:Fe-S cluster biogenesis protein NfuA
LANPVDCVESALAQLRHSLDADGFDLLLGQITAEGQVSVVLSARPGACLDCLVPDHMLIKIIDSAIRKNWPDAGEVVLEKSGFEN